MSRLVRGSKRVQAERMLPGAGVRSAGLLLFAEAQGKLGDARVGEGAADAAEGGGAEAAVGLCELGCVEDVEELGAELHFCFADNLSVFHQSEIDIAISGAAGGIA